MKNKNYQEKYTTLKAKVIGRRNAVESFLNGMDMEIMGHFETVKDAVAQLKELNELVQTIEKLEA